MHSDKVTATGPEKKKQNLLITANISLRLSNDLLFSFPPCHISPSGGFAAVCSVCLAAHFPLWSPVWGILLSKHCFITGFPVRLHISLSTHSGFCSSHSEKKQDLSSQIVLSLVPVLPHSPSLWFICMRDSRGTSDSHSGSADRYPALCAWACCVFLRVRQGTGGRELRADEGKTLQAARCPLAETSQQRAGGLHSQTRSMWMCNVTPPLN